MPISPRSQLHQWKQQEVAEWTASPCWSELAPPSNGPSVRPENGGASGIDGVEMNAAYCYDNTDCQVGATAMAVHFLQGRVRGGEGLQRYAAPGGDHPSVVMSRHLNHEGMPLDTPERLMASLNSGGVTRLVLGHTPHGNCPTVVKSGGVAVNAPQLEVIMADTSYSDVKCATLWRAMCPSCMRKTRG